MATSDSIPQSGPAESEPPLSFVEVETMHRRVDSALEVLLSAHFTSEVPPAVAVAHQLVELLTTTRKIYVEYEKLQRAAAKNKREQEQSSFLAYMEREMGPLSEDERKFAVLVGKVPVEERPWLLARAAQTLAETQKKSGKVYDLKGVQNRKRAKTK